MVKHWNKSNSACPESFLASYGKAVSAFVGSVVKINGLTLFFKRAF